MTSNEPKYSQQLVSAIEEYLLNVTNDKNEKVGESLIAFFANNKHRLPADQKEKSFKDFIFDTLHLLFKGKILKEELLDEVAKIKKSRLQKRSRWTNLYLEKLGYKFEKDRDETLTFREDDKKHPLYHEFIKCEDDPVKLILAERQIVEEWKNGDTCFFQFPKLDYIRPSSLLDNLRIDVILFTWKYISEKLGGNIPYFYRSFPNMLLEIPIFASSSLSLVSQSISENALESYYYDEDGEKVNVKLEIRGSRIKTPRVMDLTDLKILSAVLFYYKKDLYKKKINDNPRSLEVEAREFTQFLLGYHLNGDSIDMIAARLFKLNDYSYSEESRKRKKATNLFSTIDDDKTSDPRMFRFIMGDELYDSFVNDRLVKITENNYHKLEVPLSRVIYFALERKRLMLLETGRTSDILGYNFFQKITRFKSDSVEENIAEIEESLNDFIKNGVCIASCRKLGPDYEKGKKNKNDSFVDPERFSVEFKPLSKEEDEDLSYNEVIVDEQ